MKRRRAGDDDQDKEREGEQDEDAKPSAKLQSDKWVYATYFTAVRGKPIPAGIPSSVTFFNVKATADISLDAKVKYACAKALVDAHADAPRWKWASAEVTCIYDTGEIDPDAYVVSSGGEDSALYEYTVLYGSFNDCRPHGGKDCTYAGSIILTSRHPYYPGTGAFFREYATAVAGPNYRTVGLPPIHQIFTTKK